MGVGKTTILNNIKQQTKYTCIDLDESIENKNGQIDNIFLEKGEIFFREIFWGARENFRKSTRDDLKVPLAILRNENLADLNF